MRWNEPLLAELRIEAATTRSLLERVPGGSLDWRPHPRSRTLAELASHIAEIPGIFLAALDREAFDRTGPSFAAASTEELVARLDANVARAAEVLAGLEDAHFFATWRYLVEGRVVFELPRFVVARTTAFNHLVHHRGQLSVYLRLLDVPLPPIYGPTADSASP